MLILYSFESEVGLFSEFDESLRATLKSGGIGRIEFHTEFLDLARFASPQHEKELETHLRSKYSTEKIDLIIPVSLPAINFVLSRAEKLFPHTPVVLCAVGRHWIETPPLPSNVTGVVETTRISDTVAAALRLQPDTRRVVVVGGRLPYERDWINEIQADLREYEKKLEIAYLTNLSMDELSRKLANLPEHAIVLYVMMWRDGAGEYFLPEEALARIAQSSNAPIYGVFERFVGSGLVGGDIVPFKTAGAMAAVMGLRVLRGDKPADLPMLFEDNARYMFDWRQLRRWHISEQRLPPGSILLFKEPSAWQLYKWQTIGAILLIAVEAVLIALLLVQRRRRQRAEADLRESEARYLAFVANSSEGIARFEADQPMPVSLSDDDQIEYIFRHGRLAECNDAYARMYGIANPRDFIGARLSDLLLPSEPQNVEFLRAFVRSKYKLIDHVTHERDRQGKMHWFENRATGIIEDGCLTRAWTVQRDITEHKLMQERIQKAADEWQSTFDSIEDLVLIVDRDSRVVRVNEAASSFLKLTPEEIVGKSCYSLMHGAGCRLVDCPVTKTLATHRREEIEPFDDKRKSWFLASAHPIMDDQGQVAGAVHIVKDITERKRAEEVLRESERKYRQLYESMIDAFIRVDIQGRFTECNDAYCKLVGYTRQELAKLTYKDLTPERWHAFEDGIIERQVLAQGYSEIYEKEYRRKDGAIMPVELRTYLLRDEAENPCGMWAIVRDITERRQVEEALRKAEEEYRNIFEEALEGIYRTSPEGNMLAANPALARMLGYSSTEEVESFVTDSGQQLWLDPNERRTFIKLLEEREIVRGYECQNMRRDGTKIWVSLNSRRVRGPDGQTLYYEGFIEDITERKRAVDSLREQAVFNELMTGILSRFAVCSSSEVDASVEKALQAIAEFIGADHAYVCRFSADGTTWSATHEWCGPNVKPQIQQFQSKPIGTVPRTESRLLAGEAVRVSSPDDYPPDAATERRHREAEGHLAALNVPIRTKAGILGSIGLHSHARPVVWSDDDVAHLRVVGDAVATALERKQSMEELRKSEEKFSKAFHGSPVAMTILSLATGRYIDVNKAHEQNTGYRADEIISRTPEEFGVYVNPVDMERMRQARVTQVRLRNQETQYRTKAGDLRVALLSTEMIEFGGEPCMLQVSEDITERKRAETTLREIGLRMLMAQEEERRRVARELHDDFSQRLALLAIDLEELAQRPPATRHDWAGRLQSMWSQTQELTSDIHRLSRQLHPSKLEDMGLVMAVRSYCHEISKQAKLTVEFLHEDVPQLLPREISLCLYRIVQEALRNVVKHSGSKSAVVELTGEPDAIHLAVSDSGKGFDVEASKEGEGIGLVSMRERARYVGGHLSIDCPPSGGTRVEVRIPLTSKGCQEAVI